MELYRKAYNDLLRWKSQDNKHPLIIDGLRQVGKTYLAKQFGEDNYEHVIFFDLRFDLNARDIFKLGKSDKKMSIDLIIQRARLYFSSQQIIPFKTLFILDEINDCPEARECLKLFTSDKGIDVIATGSLLGLSDFKVKNIPSGYESYLTLKPLDFEEFLLSLSVKQETIDLIYESIKLEKRLEEPLLDILYNYFLRYVVVGGMPEAVLIFVQSQDLVKVREKLTFLLKDYIADFGKRFRSDGSCYTDAKLYVRIASLFSTIHVQLAKDGSKKFKYKDIPSGGRSAEFSEAISWLEKTGLIVRCFNTSSVEAPLSGNYYYDKFKIYFPDIGLLLANYPISIYSEILKGNLGAYKGAIYESISAEMIYKANLPLFYHEETLEHLENDFLIENFEGIDIYEVKATNGKLNSAKKLLSKNSPYNHQIKHVYKLIDKRYGEGEFYKSFPRFLLPFKLAIDKENTLLDLSLEPLKKI